MEGVGQPAEDAGVVEGAAVDDFVAAGADEEVAGVLDEADVIDILARANHVLGAAVDVDVEERERGGCHLDDPGFKCAADDADGKREGIDAAGQAEKKQGKGTDHQEKDQKEDGIAAHRGFGDADAIRSVR